MAAKKKRKQVKNKPSLQWVAVPIALAIVVAAGIALLGEAPAGPSASVSREELASGSGPVSSGGAKQEQIGATSRDRLREILRAADSDDPQ